jgi:hypothetical protein
MRWADEKLPPAPFVRAPDEEQPTKRSHYNPAFWTALWNEDYFTCKKGRKARDQQVSVLNLRAGKVFRTKVANLHVEEGLGLVTVNKQELLQWSVANAPHDSLGTETAGLSDEEDIQIGLEGLFSGLEKGPAFKATFELIQTGKIISREQKAFVSAFLLTQVHRHPKSVAAMIRRYERGGRTNWEALLEMRDLWSPGIAGPQMLRLSLAHWTLHLADVHTFPLPDDPVLVNDARNRIWAVISPRILLEIALDRQALLPCTQRAFRLDRDKSMYRNFRRLAINQATTEILFHDPSTLEDWRMSPEFCERLAVLGLSQK